MLLKRISAVLLAGCMALAAAGCGTASTEDGTGSGQETEKPTLEQIYAANTLEAYQADDIQPSFSTCMRVGKEKKESNALLTLYYDDVLGTICRYRKTETGMLFKYYFQHDGQDFYTYAEANKDGSIKEKALVIQADAAQKQENSASYAEQLFEKYGFGSYNSKERITSMQDCGETYHIVTDISALSGTGDNGRTYTYTTQEYDVEKKSLRILDIFRTYTMQNANGEEKTCTMSRSMTYSSDGVVKPADFIEESLVVPEWSRTITLVSDAGKQTVSVPNGIPVLIQAPSGYTAYTDSACTKKYTEDTPSADRTYPDRTIYLNK